MTGNVHEKAMRRAVGQVLRRIEEGMTTAVDAEFLRELLEKLAPNLVKQPFQEKSAS